MDRAAYERLTDQSVHMPARKFQVPTRFGGLTVKNPASLIQGDAGLRVGTRWVLWGALKVLNRFTSGCYKAGFEQQLKLLFTGKGA